MEGFYYRVYLFKYITNYIYIVTFEIGLLKLSVRSVDNEGWILESQIKNCFLIIKENVHACGFMSWEFNRTISLCDHESNKNFMHVLEFSILILILPQIYFYDNCL